MHEIRVSDENYMRLPIISLFQAPRENSVLGEYPHPQLIFYTEYLT